jgi:hypothetical protein
MKFSKFVVRIHIYAIFVLMRFVAVILSVYILLLSVFVNCTDCCVDDELCAAEQQQTEDVPLDCTDTCSPFSICNTCMGFILYVYDYTPMSPAGIFCLIAFYPQNAYSSPLIHAVWQPPQFA